MNSGQDLLKSGDIQTLDGVEVEDKQMQEANQNLIHLPQSDTRVDDMLQYLMDDIDWIIADQLKDVDTDSNFRNELIAGLSFYIYALATPETLAVGREFRGVQLDENPEAVKKIMSVLIKADPQWMAEEIYKVKEAVKEGYYISRSFKNRAGPSLLQSGDISNLDSTNQRLLFAGMLANNPHLLKETTDEMWQFDPDTMAEALDILDSDGTDRKRMDHNPDVLLFIAGKMLDKNPYVLERVISERHGFRLTILLTPLALIVMIFIIVKVIYHNPTESIAAKKEKGRRKRQKERQKKKRLVVELPGSKPKKKKKAVPKADSANKVVNQKKWKKKTKSVQPVVVVPEEVKLRKLWMDSIHRVHEEAESTFKEIRQRIEAENLKRTAPKEKKPSRKSKLSDQKEITFLGTDVGGKKAGKSQFIVNVGATEHLYKTTKVSAGSKQSSKRMPYVDLHGMSKAEALDTLNKRLPDTYNT